MFGGSGLVEMFKSDKKLTDKVPSAFQSKTYIAGTSTERIGEQSGESLLSES